MEQSWTTKAALDWCTGYLERKGDEAPRRSAERLVCDAAGIDRMQLFMDPERPLSEDERATLREHVTRRGQGEPLQYITGEAPFRFLSVRVRPGVLIPRPETEVLVSEVLAMLPAAQERKVAWNAEAADAEAAAVAALKAQLADAGAVDVSGRSADVPSDQASLYADVEHAFVRGEEACEEASDDAPALLVADLCTGSGCIACSLVTERPDVRAIATDIASQAVELARENASALGVTDRMRVLEGDLGTPIPDRYLGRFDAVVANPPYIPTDVMAQLPHEVSDFEPECALDGGADGLDVYRRIVAWAATALKLRGVLAVELHETCLDQAADIAAGAGFMDVRITDDLAGRPRVLICRWKEQ